MLLLLGSRLHILGALAGAAELVGAARIRSVGLAVVAGILLIVGVLDRLLGMRLLHAVLRWLHWRTAQTRKGFVGLLLGSPRNALRGGIFEVQHLAGMDQREG